MARLLGLGDNTVDLYLSSGTMYPGGNAVNVAVRTARLGRAASYLGRVGDDEAGRLLLGALEREGVDVGRVRRVPGRTAWSRVRHRDRDREFVGSDPGVSTGWTPSGEDLAFAARHDVVHTGLYSDLDAALPDLRAAARLLSYDFTSEWTEAHLAAVAPLVDLAFLSAGDADTPTCLALAERVAALGPRAVVVTRGARGALALAGGRVVHRAPVPTDVVDTLGAGDALVAGFLDAWLDAPDPDAALAAGAREAALACRTPGGFGHGVPWTDPDAPR